MNQAAVACLFLFVAFCFLYDGQNYDILFSSRQAVS